MDLEVLRKAPLFTNLDDEVFSALTTELTEVELSRGASAFHEGDQGDQLYVIMSGKIKLGRTAPDGRENLLAVLGPGEIFGEMALFNPAPRTASATAVSATRLAGLRHDNLRKVIQSTPEVSMQLLRALAQRLSKTNESLADLVFSDVPGRVAKALLDLADRFGRPAADGLLVAHDLTQEELAQLVGASRETVNKALAEFVQRGWIPEHMEDAPPTSAPDAPLVGLVQMSGIREDVLAREYAAAGRFDLQSLPRLGDLDVALLYDTLDAPRPRADLLVVLGDDYREHASAELPTATYDHITRPYLTPMTHFGYAFLWYGAALLLVWIFWAGWTGRLARGSR